MDGGGETVASATKQKVVVVGGGIAGSLLARSIQDYADVTLIDPKEYFEIPWASLRSKVDPSFADKALFNHSEYLTNGRVIISSANSVTETKVLTTDGHEVPYNYLVVATGHAPFNPRCRRDRMEQFQEENIKIKNSGSILIIGGGPTGVELAGEIAVDYPEKKVTLVHNGPRLLQFISPGASKKALDWLKSKKVEVLLEQSIGLGSISEADKTFMTSAGETVIADSYFVCLDKHVASSWLQESVLKERINRMGRVMVDENLRVAGHRNVFAIGDITDIQEIKQGYLAQKHAKVVAKNLKILMNGTKNKTLVKYKPSIQVAMISLGRNSALAQVPFLTMAGSLPGMIKSKHLFVDRTRRKMGLEC
ncbi:uncharacterized protein A4U43_C04F7390 [Asparagus officinalis]|uniref:FAD/NAD(P)-binding domain-containing protein n=1 Tax=Asparagus officinalis TaxID=4686 RepID=A0A5P1EZF6_ASPOF|nr:apoptosis-inducing factor homolog B-like [Asparagus officinalis]ONK71332.1 uncharacterized protein A4U43_C04F7390 [Asparagus officinalis]